MRALAVIAAVLLPLPLLAQVRAGGEFAVNTYTSGQQSFPRAAADGAGNFTVVWGSQGQDGSGYGVFAQRLDAAGARRGVEFRVNTYTTGDQTFAFSSRAALDVGPRGRTTAAWSSVGQDGSGQGVFGRMFDGAGLPFGSELAVNVTTAGAQFEPAVAQLSNGGFVVVWTSYAQDGSGDGVVGQVFDSGGDRRGGEFQVNTTTASYQKDPQVAAAGTGFVVVWTTDGPHPLHGITTVMGQRFDGGGARVGAEFQASTTPGYHYFPALAAAPDGRFVVAWEVAQQDGSGLGVFGRRFDAQGQPAGGEFLINAATAGDQWNVSAAMDDAGAFAAAWTSSGQDGSGNGVFAQRFAGDGARRGAEFVVPATTAGSQSNPSLASDPSGNLLVTWMSADGSGSGVFGQRFGGLLPAALALVDGDNGVLEVPDDFTLRTAWRNVSGASQSFQGRASEITVPNGLFLTLGFDAAYGTVPDGATATCIGPCFSGGLLGTRPPGHVDLGLLETITPDALGQKKRWRVHVGGSFGDVPRTSGFYRFVETLLHHGITGGCATNAYCPGNPTTREQMAAFVLAAKEGLGYQPPACAPPNIFGDVPETSAFCRWIEELSRRGVVGGCGGGNYCPFDPVTREQMAVFTLRTLDATLDPPPCAPPNLFADVPETSLFCRWIEELASRQVVVGCGGGNYCPTAPVTREQMGVFIAATFGLTLYGP